MFLKILHPDSGLLDPGILSTSLAIYTFCLSSGIARQETRWSLNGPWKSGNRTLDSFIPMSNIDWDRVPCVRSNTIYFFTVIKTNTRTDAAKKCVGSVADIKAFSASAFVFLSAPASSNLSFLYLREDWDEYSSRGRPGRRQRNLVYFRNGG